MTYRTIPAISMSKHEVFREHLSSIQTSIQTSVCDVAEKCWTRGMIAESVYQSVVYGVKTPGEKNSGTFISSE